MNEFHRHRLLSGIHESHQVPVQSEWAYAIRKQARLILMPLFREVIVTWKEEITGIRPYLTDLVKELFLGFFQTGSILMSVHSELEKIISEFLESLELDDLDVLKFYFLSKQDEVDILYQQILDQNEPESTLEEDSQELCKIFQNRFENLSMDELIGFMMEELSEVENILSDSDLESDLDTEAINRINKAFSDYLDIPNGEIFLIKKPLDDWEFWEKVTAEIPETVGKRIHTDQGLEWVACWLLPNGKTRIKGDFLDEPERDSAAIQAIKQELQVILKNVHQQLIKHYGLFDSHIHYAFFTRRKKLENIIPAEGIQFFMDQIKGHGAEDFEPFINIYIRRYQQKVLQEWGAQISLGIEQRHWLSEDEYEEYKVWVITMEGEATPLETIFSEKQKESISRSILENIHRCYEIDYGHA